MPRNELNFAQFAQKFMSVSKQWNESGTFGSGFQPNPGTLVALLTDIKLIELESAKDHKTTLAFQPVWRVVESATKSEEEKTFEGSANRISEKSTGFSKGFLRALSGEEECGDADWALQVIKDAPSRGLVCTLQIEYSVQKDTGSKWIRETILDVTESEATFVPQDDTIYGEGTE